MNRLNTVLTAEEVIDLKLARDDLRKRERYAIYGQDDLDRDRMRVLRVLEKLLQSIGPTLQKHEEP